MRACRYEARTWRSKRLPDGASPGTTSGRHSPTSRERKDIWDLESVAWSVMCGVLASVAYDLAKTAAKRIAAKLMHAWYQPKHMR